MSLLVEGDRSIFLPKSGVRFMWVLVGKGRESTRKEIKRERRMRARERRSRVRERERGLVPF